LLVAALLTAGGTAFTAASVADDAKAAQGSDFDKTFVVKAAGAGMAEVKLGQLATERGASDAVKKFGERMVADHSKANKELKGLVDGKGIALPKEMDKHHKEAVEKLGQLKGDQFDREFAQQMVRDHLEAVALFEKASKNVQDPELKGFATKTLPTLSEHLKMAQDLAEKVKGGGKRP